MILVTVERRQILTLLAYPLAAGKWTKLDVDHVSITISKETNAHQKFSI